jgi:hypothetical protein
MNQESKIWQLRQKARHLFQLNEAGKKKPGLHRAKN